MPGVDANSLPPWTDPSLDEVPGQEVDGATGGGTRLSWLTQSGPAYQSPLGNDSDYPLRHCLTVALADRFDVEALKTIANKLHNVIAGSVDPSQVATWSSEQVSLVTLREQLDRQYCQLDNDLQAPEDWRQKQVDRLHALLQQLMPAEPVPVASKVDSSQPFFSKQDTTVLRRAKQVLHGTSSAASERPLGSSITAGYWFAIAESVFCDPCLIEQLSATQITWVITQLDGVADNLSDDHHPYQGFYLASVDALARSNLRSEQRQVLMRLLECREGHSQPRVDITWLLIKNITLPIVGVVGILLDYFLLQLVYGLLYIVSLGENCFAIPEPKSGLLMPEAWALCPAMFCWLDVLCFQVLAQTNASVWHGLFVALLLLLTVAGTAAAVGSLLFFISPPGLYICLAALLLSALPLVYSNPHGFWTTPLAMAAVITVFLVVGMSNVMTFGLPALVFGACLLYHLVKHFGPSNEDVISCIRPYDYCGLFGTSGGASGGEFICSVGDSMYPT